MWPRIMIVVATCAAISLALALVLFLRGCANEHSRPRGHGDISFGISPRGDELVFDAVGEGGRDLYRLDLASLRVTRIVATLDREVDPEFSPDGKSVVYAAGKPGDRADHIFIRSLDGKRVTQLTWEDANDSSPAFSPDGALIVFARDKTYQWGGLAANWTDGVLCVMKADGSDLREITRVDMFASDPHFSPDGETILFRRLDALYTVSADGSRLPRPLGLNGRNAVYSPDGQSIAFSRGRYSPDQRIFVARADRTGPTLVTHPLDGQVARPRGGCTWPAFTPDGKRLFFFEESWPEGPTGDPKESLWQIDLEGGTPRQIAGYGLFDDPLNWKPESPKPGQGP